MCSKEEIIEMSNTLFHDYDTNNSGFLERDEVKKIINTIFNEISKSHQIDETKANKMFTASDTNSDNKLSKAEFMKIVEIFLEPVYL